MNMQAEDIINMKNELSISMVESALNNLEYTLNQSEWNDSVKNTYYHFINDERSLIMSITWDVNRANAANNNSQSIDVSKAQNDYKYNLSIFEQLKRDE